MNLRQIEAFRALMLHGSVTAAARALAVSQPAVTRLIRLLEDRAGLRLFAREKGRLVPTREARLLHEELGRVYEGVERVRGVVARLREHGGGEVRMLCALSVAHSLAMERLAGVPRDARDLRLVLDTAPFAPMMEALAARRADVGVAMAAAPVPDLASRVVATLEFALAVPRTHRLAAASAARAADLRGERLVTYRPGSPLFGILRGTPFGEVLDRGAVEVGSSLLACAAVANGLGVAIAERGLILGPLFQGRLAYVAIMPPVRVPVRVFFHEADLQSDGIRRVLEALVGGVPAPAGRRARGESRGASR
jgi:DNA-binding transcriptional LysR family regulator